MSNRRCGSVKSGEEEDQLIKLRLNDNNVWRAAPGFVGSALNGDFVWFSDNLILNLTSCGRPLDVEKIGDKHGPEQTNHKFVFLELLCVEQLMAYVEEVGDWIRFPDTIHEGLAHLAETLG